MFTLSQLIFQLIMHVAPPLHNKPELHPHRDQLYSIFKNSVQWFLKRSSDIELPMFKLHWLIFQSIKKVVPPDELTLLTHIQGLLGYNISEFHLAVMENKIISGIY